MSLVNRRRLMGKKATLLPSEYQQVEYISSDGNQRLAICHKGPYATRANAIIEIKTKPSKTSSSEQCILGEYTEFTCDWQNGQYTGWKASVISKDVGEIDTVTWKTVKYSSKECYTCYAVFSYNRKSLSYPYAGKIYGIKIAIDPPIDIINMLIPCYRKSDGVIGLYSTYDKTFYTNLGSGTFGKGADVP